MFYLHNPTSFSQRTATTINELPDDVLAQILVRLPMHPTCLLTVSMAHKKWRYIMGSNYFRKQTLSHIAGIPLLGFFTNNTEDNRFISENDLCPAILRELAILASRTLWKLYFLGCRNGWALLHSPQGI
jgi:hypothetical protein